MIYIAGSSSSLLLFSTVSNLHLVPSKVFFYFRYYIFICSSSIWVYYIIHFSHITLVFLYLLESMKHIYNMLLTRLFILFSLFFYWPIYLLIMSHVFLNSFHAWKFLLNAGHCKFYLLGAEFCCIPLSAGLYSDAQVSDL